MQAQDRSAFFLAFASLCTAFSRNVDEALVEVYWRALSDLPVDAVRAAMDEAIMTQDFMPPPAKLRRFAGQNSNETCAEPSDEAFALVARAVREVGSYRAVDFDDPCIHATIRALGGWSNFCRAPAHEFNTWTRKRFVAIYRELSAEPQEQHHHRPLLAAYDNSEPVRFVRRSHETYAPLSYALMEVA